MRPLAIFTVFLMAILSCTCTAQRATKTVKDIFNHELFDSGVISRLPLYDSLKNILVNNKNSNCEFINKAMMYYLEEFKGEMPFVDDIAMLTCKFN